MRQRIVTLTWIFLFLAGLPAVAQKRPMSIVEMLEIPSLSNGRLSPDGKYAVYQLAEANWEKNRQVSHLWRVELSSGTTLQLTNGENGETSPRWSPDGKWIAFLTHRDDEKQNQIYLISNQGGEAEALTSHPTAVGSLQWARDGSGLYFLADDEKSDELEKKEAAQDDVYAFDENYQQQHLWKIDVESRESQRITQGDFSIRDYSQSEDGRKIVVERAPTPLYDDSDESELWIMTWDGTDARQLTRNHVTESGAEISPDNSRVLFTAETNSAFEPYYNGNLFLVSVEGGDAHPIDPDLPLDVGSASWSGNDEILFTANSGVENQLYRFSLRDKKVASLTSGEQAIRSWHFQKSTGSHLLSIDSATNPGDLWLFSDGVKRRVTHVFDYLQEEFELPRQEAITWKGKDGVEVEGLLIYPIGYQQGKRYPLVVQTHGGPASSDKFGFGDSMTRYSPVLAGKGWAILKPNYRGSTGYGNAYLRDMVGHYYQNAHLDVMAGVDRVIEMGVADPDRMVKMGWSAGGHMTDKIITFTDRFKAASSGAGAVNWISMYAQSDVRIYRTPWFGGTPWQKDAPIDVYWNNSPLKDIWKVTTPTLIFVGANDVRVPSPQSVELYRALSSNGVPTHLYIGPREPHGWRELRHRLFKMNAELEWFNKYALGKDYEWEKPPQKKSQEGPRSTEPTAEPRS